MDVLYVDNDHVVEIIRLRDADGQLIVGATAQAVLYENGTQTEVAGVSWPLVLTYDADGQKYAGDLPRGVGIVKNGRYQMKLTAVYAGKQFEVTRTVKAKQRYS